MDAFLLKFDSLPTSKKNLMETYKTQLPSGYYIVFSSSCLSEAKYKQKRLKGIYLRPYPVEDYILKQQISKSL